MTTLAAVQTRILSLQERLRRRSPPRPRPSRRPRRCGRCSGEHLRTHCPISGHHVWTNGCELWIAKGAEDAAQLEREADAAFAASDEAVMTPPEAWKLARGEGELLTLQTSAGCVEQWTEAAWIIANRRGLLAFDGRVLAPGMRVPG